MNIRTQFISGCCLVGIVFLTQTNSSGQKQRIPPGGRVGIVADERLAVLRDRPGFDGDFLRRLGRGRVVAVRGRLRNRDGISFCHINVSRRTTGWIQCDALITRSKDQDTKLARLIEHSREFERLARAGIFVEMFPASPLRPRVLLTLGNTAEELAEKLTRDASRRIADETNDTGPPSFSYFLNYSGLDRYNRQGVRFVFDRGTRRFHYSGAAWREIIRRYPNSPEANEARLRLRNQDLRASKEQ